MNRGDLSSLVVGLFMLAFSVAATVTTIYNPEVRTTMLALGYLASACYLVSFGLAFKEYKQW